jgi:hypothetical protein
MKHVFTWPRMWVAMEQPRACLTISCNVAGVTNGRRFLSWFKSQEHAPRMLPCGCTVCVLCANPLMQERKTGRWYTLNAAWLEKFGGETRNKEKEAAKIAQSLKGKRGSGF